MRTDLFATDEKRMIPGGIPSASEAPLSPAAQEKTFTFIHRRVGEDQICVLTFDRPNSSANVFDRATLEELNEHLEVIARSPDLKGVVLTSAKKPD